MAEYIDREELFRIEKLIDTDVLRASKVASTIYDQMMYDIEHISSADVAPVKHGKWVFDAESYEWNCSECHYWPIDGSCDEDRTNYCPNCGAKMDGEV